MVCNGLKARHTLCAYNMNCVYCINTDFRGILKSTEDYSRVFFGLGPILGDVSYITNLNLSIGLRYHYHWWIGGRAKGGIPPPPTWQIGFDPTFYTIIPPPPPTSYRGIFFRTGVSSWHFAAPTPGKKKILDLPLSIFISTTDKYTNKKHLFIKPMCTIIS